MELHLFVERETIFWGGRFRRGSGVMAFISKQQLNLAAIVVIILCSLILDQNLTSLLKKSIEKCIATDLNH